MAVYRVTTDQGTFNVTTDEPAPNPAVDAIKQATDAANQAPINAIPNAIMSGAQKVMDAAGNIAQKSVSGQAIPLGSQAVIPATSPVDPHVASAVGGLIRTAPTAATMVDPLAGSIPAGDMAGGFAARAAGLGKVFNKTADARNVVLDAGKAALDNSLIPRLGSPEGMAQKVDALQQTTGKALGDIRDAVGPQSLDKVFGSLEGARQELLNGAQGKQGMYQAVSNKFDEIKQTLQDLLPEQSLSPATGMPEQSDKIPLNRIVQAKNRLANSVNWFADNASQADAKRIAGALEGGVSQILESAGGDMTNYKGLKSLYQSLKTLNKGLDNELSGVAGNAPLSARAMVLGAMSGPHQLPLELARAGVIQGVIRRGAGVTANALHGVANNIHPMAAASEAYKRLMDNR